MKVNFESLDLIPIKSLLSKSEEDRLKFYVPAYQRGYRWSDTQVEQLIDDLLEFVRLHSADTSAFYCLQPLVVKEVKFGEIEMLEVIDGQQRLTTVLLILQAIHQRRFENFFPDNKPVETLIDTRFEIKYETRPSSEKWLTELGRILYSEEYYTEFDNKSCDYSHFVEVYMKAYNKLKSLNTNEMEIFYSCLCDRTYFIWFYPEDTADTNADIFDRLNAGKITLTNAELIKALMLQRSNIAKAPDSTALNTIAIEWDNIERRLNDEEFWGFIYSSNHPYSYDVHIEYIFDLFSEKKEINRDDLTYTFTHYLRSYREMMNAGGDKDASLRIKWVEFKWTEVKELMDTLNEWYADRNLYHRIGFILEYCKDHNLCTLSSELKPLNRDERINHLDEIIRGNVVGINSRQLFYKSPELSKILFLYNILLEDRRFNKTARFSFADYKNVNKNIGWDQEHIASHIDYTVKEKDREMLGKDLIQLIAGQAVIESNQDANGTKKTYSLANDALESLPEEEEKLCVSWLKILNDNEENQDEESLRDVYNETLAYYQGEEPSFGTIKYSNTQKDAKDFIWNFVLLNSKTNRSYGNHIYPIKRKRILSDEFDVYTPVGTRNVFEKAYSKRITQMTSWSPDDAKAYWSDIKKVVLKYVILKDLD